jgi:decaprenyl-phosphate phosphoribosyltransferase
MADPAHTQSRDAAGPTGAGSLAAGLFKLARVHHWAKGAFVFIGPAYALADGHSQLTSESLAWLWSAIFTALAFGLASSACYAVNDLRDAEQDRQHPRKKHRPIASGVVGPAAAGVFTLVMLLASATCLIGVLPAARVWVGIAVGLYVVNTMAYSLRLKHHVIADVICLAMGFVLRVVAGCLAVGVGPSTYLLNVAFFLAMFLAFGKRLGERRTLGSDGATKARGVQAGYSDEVLRFAVVTTAVVTLVMYAGYVLSRDGQYAWVPTWMIDPARATTQGFNLLWITMLPATYGLLRCVLLVERGRFDDPTEIATKDRPFQLAALAFGITGVLMWARSSGKL